MFFAAQDTTAKFGSPQYNMYNPPVGMEVTPFKKVTRGESFVISFSWQKARVAGV